MRTISVPTPTHGRVLIRDAPDAAPRRLLVGFHGYAQSAEDMLSELELIPGSEQWTLVSVQALHRFYLRRMEKVVASWMTRQNRDDAIADNIVYVDRVLETILDGAHKAPLVFVGFSQGVGMAYRAAVLGQHRPLYLISIGGDVPPEVKTIAAENFPPILIAGGADDALYTASHLEADEAFLCGHGVSTQVFRYPGGHEWTADLRHRISSVIGHSER